MESVTTFVETKLKLKVNRDKSAVGRPWKRKFLGYTITVNKLPRLKPAPQSIQRAKAKIRQITNSGRGRNILRVIKEVNEFVRGWFGYYRLTEVKLQFDLLDQWIRHRLRKILWEQWKTPRNRAKKLRSFGIDSERAKRATSGGRGAWWNASASHMHAAITNGRLSDWGLLSLLNMMRELKRGG